MADVTFDFKKFFDETKATILTPAEYFSVIEKTGGFVDPLIKAVIYGFVSAIINFLWRALSIGTIGGFFGGSFSLVGFLMLLIWSVIGLFIGGAIVLVISAICGGSTEYEANVRVTASLMALSPVWAIFGLFSGVNIYLYNIMSIAIFLYGFWMLYNALIKALAAKEGPAKVISILLAIIPVLIIISSLICMKAVNTVSDKINDYTPIENQEQAKKIMEDAAKNFEQIGKELQQEGKEVQK